MIIISSSNEREKLYHSKKFLGKISSMENVDDGLIKFTLKVLDQLDGRRNIKCAEPRGL